MPPPDMPPSIQKPQKSSPNVRARLLDERLGEVIGRPGNDRLDRPVEVPRRSRRRARARRRRAGLPASSSKMPQCLPARCPFRLGAEQILLRDHVQDRADVLRHAAVDEDEALLQAAARRRRERRSGPRMVWRGSKRPRLTPHSGSPSAAGDALDQLDAGPDAARVLPAAAGAAQPLAQDRAGATSGVRSLPVERTGQVAAWPVARMHGRDQRRPAGSSKRPVAIPWGCR